MPQDQDGRTSRKVRSVEDYPFDPSLKAENLTGLDRLRCIPDRSCAATLLELYALAERNETMLAQAAQRAAAAAERVARTRERLRHAVGEALAGKLGTDAQSLARHVLEDGNGEVRDDDRRLIELGRALAELGAI